VITGAIMWAPVGMHSHGSAMAYLEHPARSKVPVRAGECRNQHGEVVAEAEGKMLVHVRP
jgi:hypothetical protein